MTKKDDQRLKGRHPEFARMSLKPGIGAPAMMDVAGILEPALEVYLNKLGTFPAQLAHGKKKFPLGRYLQSILRANLGYGRKTTDAEKELFQQKMLLMQKDEAETAKAEKRAIKSYYQLKYGNTDSEVARFKIYDKRGVL